MTRRTEAERFWDKVDVQPGICWEWQACLLRNGHGQFNREGRRPVMAHRWAWEHLVGPIPDGLVLDHLCRNPRCVNPAHLEPVTPGTNTLRGYGAAALNARKTHCKNGHAFTPENTGLHSGGLGRRCRACSAEQSRNARARMRAA